MSAGGGARVFYILKACMRSPILPRPLVSLLSLSLASSVFFSSCLVVCFGARTQSSSSKVSKELQKALEDLEEERQARLKVSDELLRLEADVTDLRSEEKRIKVVCVCVCVCVCVYVCVCVCVQCVRDSPAGLCGCVFFVSIARANRSTHRARGNARQFCC